uniref:Uncharacterized protein n=1 Tax=Pristionchus pacificus TaxID=54126 RepID=A0A2A6CTJ1_PRIPA|eukprot:PDM81544.1 hypothetical protein PRIPAC_35420 [Pristionchus pacificus]
MPDLPHNGDNGTVRQTVMMLKDQTKNRGKENEMKQTISRSNTSAGIVKAFCDKIVQDAEGTDMDAGLAGR